MTAGAPSPAPGARTVHVRVWEFLVREGCEPQFEKAYGSRGAWARLFARAEGWLGTELLRITALPRRFVTVDRWASAEAFERFRAAHARAYQALDEASGHWTEKEIPVGAFEIPSE